MTELFSPPHDRVTLRNSLREAIGKTRRDAAIFAVLTVILTPIFLAGATVVLIFALAFVDLPLVDNLGYERSIVTGVNLALAFMAASYFLKPKEPYQRHKSDEAWLMIALALYCALFLLSYGTSLSHSHPIGFWSLYLGIALTMLGCIGHAYEPQEDYYLGWLSGPVLVDNPFTIQDDIDRAHVSLGFAVALANLVLTSYDEIFGSKWLWQGLKESEISASVEFLEALAINDGSRARSVVAKVGKTSSLGMIRALVKLEMIRINKGVVRLSLKGREFVGVKAFG
ncbi:hypothetical protein Geob_2720 [Geotalea daltonii FRC-32]|uniref:Uncharacterized protein n=1 Tax=Geotalea daltonii (strain DSM 22248 / JCM 15807 / FRC-32) TaxID=316067 RepID=B9M1I8_GEODF|nr:hypothetical protein [Geotalea daltonii]ACM21070.1 hypothetical protein Geob_2720 [Geotalea daltonii FRC-32]